jgi:organic hydroperoxide reductase OsmC/OhrA
VSAASSSPLSVRLPWSVAAAVDPEEALVAALASCHMLTFLYVAAKQGFVVDDYSDDAVGEMTKNERGKLWVSKVTLSPRITFTGDKRPSSEQLDELHHLAHEECYIANSVKSEVVVQGVMSFA